MSPARVWIASVSVDNRVRNADRLDLEWANGKGLARLGLP